MEDEGWERTDFPIICETCLGNNPYVKMTKAHLNKECKICTRPFTMFKWKPGRDARYKTTQLCQPCSKLQSVCQVCVLDLQYSLPVQVRDSSNRSDLNSNPSHLRPKCGVNKVFFAEEKDRKAKVGMDHESWFGKAPNHAVLKLQRRAPYYKRNLPQICSFYVRGNCTRGAECAYRHEMAVTGELAKQNIEDRYYGVNDPVAAKLLRRVEDEDGK